VDRGTSLIGFTLLYGARMVVELFLLPATSRPARAGVMPDPDRRRRRSDDPAPTTDDQEADVLAFAY
jgi:hypothetical protein